MDHVQVNLESLLSGGLNRIGHANVAQGRWKSLMGGQKHRNLFFAVDEGIATVPICGEVVLSV